MTGSQPFGPDRFGKLAERFARFFGTPKFIMLQTAMVVLWIAVNALVVALRWDPYPFIALNLLFSTQAAYAAPLILLAQTRQADRDKHHADLAEQHRELLHGQLVELIEANTELTEQDKDLTEAVHKKLAARRRSPAKKSTRGPAK